ncbi:DUF7322 domain-containing protein [Haloplanus halophilus]|uniref:DUF7322 domain-containing protein n=1 Tax=Haloplanus halophilus TaxID=2949993 RepID=UPI0020419DD1|nr:hypothetical protein [Haloplanus sp. GDY1]
MPFDSGRDEADETDLEARAADLGPDPPRAPTPDTDPSDVDPEIRGLFWRSVLMANVAVFCLAFGPMLVGFEGAWTIGTVTVVVGVIAGLRVYHLYRIFRRRDEGPEADERNP